MKVCVVLEQRFMRTGDGTVWTDGPCPRSFWDRYLDVFDEVRVVARVKPVASLPAGAVRADGRGVVFAPVVHYIGMREFLGKAFAVRRSVIRGVGPSDAVILRVPSHLATLVVPTLVRRRHPFAVEVLGDPYDVFSPGAIRHPLRPFLRWRFSSVLRQQCRQAFAAAYVTAEALQRRYPLAPAARGFYYSDVQIDGLIAETARAAERKTSWNLISVGSLGHLYKAPDVQIDAIDLCRRAGFDVRLTLVGDGKHRAELEQRAAALGLAKNIHFRGQVASGRPICDELDRADLFLLPSRQEGLPRALIEAMARGLPCIGSHAGGIPELLPDEDRVHAGDARGLAQKIQEVLSDPDRLHRMSVRNLERSGDFQEETLRERRMAFYRFVRERTEVWLERSGRDRLPLPQLQLPAGG